jgi:hypothetical protein
LALDADGSFSIAGEKDMKKTVVLSTVLVVLVAGLLYFVVFREPATAEQECVCSNGTVRVQNCRVDGSGCEPCECIEYTIWCDPDTDLCWQDPQREAYNYEDIGLTAKATIQYCDELVLGGYDDWRLPAIKELRSLLAGSPDTEAGGDCPVDADCTFMDSWTASCMGRALGKGPGVNGCYLKDGLTGTCDRPDAYSAGHFLEVWAIESASDDERWIASIMPDIGGVCFNHVCSVGDVRCVRSAPSEPVRCAEEADCTPGATRKCECEGYQQPPGAQVCDESGDCWGPCECTGYTRNPEISPECYNNICPESDKLELTIDLPEGAELPFEAHMLIAFLYDAKRWEFPPGRPPEGGTDYNQIIKPGMPPYKMSVPACTYYGEYVLEGDYQLYIHLQLREKFPPVPLAADYYWGNNQEAFTFPLNGSEHQGAGLKVDITLESVGEASCPDATPVRCSDGACVADASECASCGDGKPVPDDTQVLTCRYKSSFVDDNCADFPIDQGWIAADVESFCKGQQGADASTVVVSQGKSCMVEKGMTSDSKRCATDDSGKEWYAYGVPSFVCSTIMGGENQSGPFCEEY